jgi:phosphatidylglycerol:prolipoprotein diacylglycerol transferase
VDFGAVLAYGAGMLVWPHFNPVAIQLGPLAVRWYGISYVVTLLLGLWYSKKIALWHKAKNITPDTIDNFFIWVTLGVILGGRIGYVLFYGWPHFMEDPLWALRVWEGGMSFHGGALGVIIAVFAFSWRNGIHPADLGDRVTPAVPIGCFLVRLANFVNGELWGRHVLNPDATPWAMVFPQVDPLPRHPSQLYEAGLEGLLLGLALWLAVRHGGDYKFRRWVPTGVFLTGYGIARFTVEFFREPEITHTILGFTITQGQTLSLPLIVAGLVCFWRAYRPRA